MADFQTALNITLDNEGKYVNNPNDPGGETKYGISKRSYPHLNIAELTLEKAIALYKEDFWDKMKLDQITHQILANKIFDIGVNIGIRPIIKVLQKTLNEYQKSLIVTLVVDGVIGTYTINRCNCLADIGAFMTKFKHNIVEYYKTLNKPCFMKGWIARAEQ